MSEFRPPGEVKGVHEVDAERCSRCWDKAHDAVWQRVQELTGIPQDQGQVEHMEPERW